MTYTIEKEIATISTTGSRQKKLCLVSWNGNPAKYDLRIWRDQDGEQAPGKGVTLNETEAAALAEALAQVLDATGRP